jgi:hypothetical protein
VKKSALCLTARRKGNSPSYVWLPDGEGTGCLMFYFPAVGGRNERNENTFIVTPHSNRGYSRLPIFLPWTSSPRGVAETLIGPPSASSDSATPVKVRPRLLLCLPAETPP